jgi:hypothetical protein
MVDASHMPIAGHDAAKTLSPQPQRNYGTGGCPVIPIAFAGGFAPIKLIRGNISGMKIPVAAILGIHRT